MVHETPDVKPLQLKLETSTGGVIGRKEHDQYRFRAYMRVLRIVGRVWIALGIVSLDKGKLSMSKDSDMDSDMNSDSLSLSPAFGRMDILCRSGPAHATRACGSFHVLIWIRFLGGDSRGILHP